MAINERIENGKAYRVWDPDSGMWVRISFWGDAQDVEFADGQNAQDKLGVINGITDSLVSNDSTVAASSVAVNTLNQNLNNRLGGLSFTLDENGNPCVLIPGEAGADPVSKKLGSGKVTIKNYKVDLYAQETTATSATDGVNRFARSSLTLNAEGFDTLYIGKYTATSDSGHAGYDPELKVHCQVNDVSQKLSTSNGITIDVSGLTTVKLTIEVKSTCGNYYFAEGTINISEITLS